MFAFHSPKLVNYWLVSQVDHKMRYQIKKDQFCHNFCVMEVYIFAWINLDTLENMLNTPHINWCFHRYHQFDPRIKSAVKKRVNQSR